MTGPQDDGDDRTLFVQPSTLARLSAQERIAVAEIDGHAVFTFKDTDPLHAGRTVRHSSDVTPNAVHARRWNSSENRYIFEYVSDV